MVEQGYEVALWAGTSHVMFFKTSAPENVYAQKILNRFEENPKNQATGLKDGIQKVLEAIVGVQFNLTLRCMHMPDARSDFCF